MESYQISIAIAVIVCLTIIGIIIYYVYNSSKPQPITSMAVIKQNPKLFSIIALPLSVASSYPSCSKDPTNQMYCPPTGGAYLVQYDSSSKPLFTSWIPIMSILNDLVNMGVNFPRDDPIGRLLALSKSGVPYVGKFNPIY
jgi:hypothetical protein